MRVPDKNLDNRLKEIDYMIDSLIWGIGITILILFLIFTFNVKKTYSKLYDRGKCEAIVKIYEKSSKAKPEELIYIANSYYKTNQKDKALNLYRNIFANQTMDTIAVNPYELDGYLNYIEIAKSQRNLEPITKFASTDLSNYKYRADLIIAQNMAKQYLATTTEEARVYEGSKIKIDYSLDRKHDLREGGYIVDKGKVYINKEALKRDFTDDIDLSKIKSIKVKNISYYDLNAILEGPLKTRFKAFIEITPENLKLSVLPIMDFDIKEKQIKVKVNESLEFILEEPVIKDDNILFPINRIFFYNYGKNYVTKEDSKIYKDTEVYTSMDNNLRIFKKGDDLWFNHHAEKIDLDTIALNVFPKVMPVFTDDEIFMDASLMKYYLKDYKLDVKFDEKTRTASFTFNDKKPAFEDLRYYVKPDEFIRLNKVIFSENPKNVIFWVDYTRRKAYEKNAPKNLGIENYKISDEEFYNMICKYYEIDKGTFKKFIAIPVE